MAVVEGVGRLRYVQSRDHEHWHLLGFERYELRRAGGGTRRVTDRKTGFCLGDRYRTGGRALPGAAAGAPLHQPLRPRRRPTGCASSRASPSATATTIAANLEGQSLPLTGLAAGRYVLVHRVNVRRRLRETDYGNNAASLLLRLRWRAGVPRVRVLRRCPDTERCHDEHDRRTDDGDSRQSDSSHGWRSDPRHSWWSPPRVADAGLRRGPRRRSGYSAPRGPTRSSAPRRPT